MRLSNYNTEAIIRNLRTFSYTTKEDGETVTKNVTLFSDAQAPLVNRFFLQYKGSLKADDIMDAYKKGDVSASDVASMILLMTKSQLVNLWRIWEADYNPLWNVDGTEKKVIKTEFGKVVDHEKDSSITDEQLTDGKSNVTHGHTLTDNQTVDGKQNTTHGLQTTITEPTTTDTTAAFDSGSNFENRSQSSATTHTNTDSGTTNVALSMGTVLHTEGGTTNTALSMGKIEHKSEGKDTDTESGDETTTETYTRSGNIGVTMSTQLLRDGDNFWSQFNFFEKYFELIAEPLTIPIYDDEED